MGALRGVLVGSLGLTLMYDLVTTQDQAGVTTLAGLPGRVANYLISSTVPLIPDLTSSSSASSPGTLSGTGTVSGGNSLGSLSGAAGVLGSLSAISDVTPAQPATQATPSTSGSISV